MSGALLLLWLAGCILVEAAHRDVLARSDFHWGDEDWSVFGPGRVQVYARTGMLYAADKGKKVWYFRAPEAFVGDKCFAHNGELSFRLGHSEYMSNGKDMIRDWDVILESKLWKLRFGVRDLIPPWVGSTKQTISLNEKSWTNMATGHSPTTTEMLRMLTAVSALYIRGGYYDGHEETWIDEVVMTEGDHKEDVLLRRIEKHAVHPTVAKERERAKAEAASLAPPVEHDAHLDFEERIAREQAQRKIQAAQEAKEKEERDKAAELAAFQAAATLKDVEAAKALEHRHEEKGEMEGDLTAEELSYAVDAGEKEMLRKLREDQELAQAAALKQQAENDAAEARAREHMERQRLQTESLRKQAQEAKDHAHEKHLEEHVHGEHESRDVRDLHHKAHEAAAARKKMWQHEKSPSPPPAPIPETPAQPAPASNDEMEGDISIEEVAQIAAEQQHDQEEAHQHQLRAQDAEQQNKAEEQQQEPSQQVLVKQNAPNLASEEESPVLVQSETASPPPPSSSSAAPTPANATGGASSMLSKNNVSSPTPVDDVDVDGVSSIVVISNDDEEETSSLSPLPDIPTTTTTTTVLAGGAVRDANASTPTTPTTATTTDTTNSSSGGDVESSPRHAIPEVAGAKMDRAKKRSGPQE